MKRSTQAVGAAVTAAAVAAGAKTVHDVRRSAQARAMVALADGPYDFTTPADRELTVVADDGVRLHVEIHHAQGCQTSPDTPTVYLAHGFTLDNRMWLLQRRVLAEAGYRVVAWDHRSHGKSSRSAKQNCTIAYLAKDLVRIIETVSPQAPLLIGGHSMGGMALMALPEVAPAGVLDRVQGVAFVATSAGGPSEKPLGLGPIFARLLAAAGPLLMGGLSLGQGWLNPLRRFGHRLEDHLLAEFGFATPVPQSVVDLLGDMIFSTPLAVMGDFLRTLEDHGRVAQLRRFADREVLILNGTQDKLTPPQHSQEIADALPLAEHLVFTHAGHLPMLEYPGRVSAELLALAERAFAGSESRTG